MPLSPETKLGAYEILSCIGAGGMGEVYRARDGKLGREVAIKVLPSSVANDPERIARFEREARLLAALNHPKIATLHGLEESEGVLFLVMEPIEGQTRRQTAPAAVPGRRDRRRGCSEPGHHAGKRTGAPTPSHRPSSGLCRRMTEHISAERCADYLAGLLDERADDELEAHLFSCRSCAFEAEKLAGLAVAVHRAVPPVLTAARFEELEREGRIAEVNPISPGQIAEALFPQTEKLLVFRLGGSDLSRARRVDMELLDLDGKVLARFDDVPFDVARGEVLVACQSHFAGLFPPDMVFRLERVVGDTREEANRYTVLHALR